MFWEIAVSFVIEVGIWAKEELGEIWTLRYKQIEVDISMPESATKKVPPLIELACTSWSEVAFKENWQLIEERRTALRIVKKTEAAELALFSSGELPRSVYEERARKLIAFKKLMFDEIAHELSKVGIIVQRENVCPPEREP